MFGEDMKIFKARETEESTNNLLNAENGEKEKWESIKVFKKSKHFNCIFYKSNTSNFYIWNLYMFYFYENNKIGWSIYFAW